MRSVLHSGEHRAFSLVEVVLALGVVSFAVVGILAVFPAGLRTSQSSQNDTRAPQIAQKIYSEIAAQAANSCEQGGGPCFNRVQFSFDASNTIDLAGDPDDVSAYADNEGALAQEISSSSVYLVRIAMDKDPPGFDSDVASQVTVRVAWPAHAANASDRTERQFVRIISKY
jgi:uncharacterized protein (TIGR02598 family)